MTQYAEVIYETGSKAIVSYEDLNQLKEGLRIQHQRALAGEDGGPHGAPAERVTRVLLYDDHPGEDTTGGLLDAKAAKQIIDGLTQGDLVSGHEVIAALRDEMSPVYTVDPGRHESNYKAQETEELNLDFLEGDK